MGECTKRAGTASCCFECESSKNVKVIRFWHLVGTPCIMSLGKMSGECLLFAKRCLKNQTRMSTGFKI